MVGIYVSRYKHIVDSIDAIFLTFLDLHVIKVKKNQKYRVDRIYLYVLRVGMPFLYSEVG